MKICFFHLFKCGGTTFNWILQNNFPGRVLYAEKPVPCRGRLKAASVQDYLSSQSEGDYEALSSHLAEPACADLALFPCSILRVPSDRNWSAYHFQIRQGTLQEGLSYQDYLEKHHDFQIRVLGGEQVNSDALKLALARFNLGILERFEESMVVFEWLLERQGLHLNLAYPGEKNRSKKKLSQSALVESRAMDDALKMSSYWYDLELYRNATEQLNNHLAAMPDRDARMDDYAQRCDQAREQERLNKLTRYGTGPDDFTYIEPTTVPGLRPGFGS